MKTINFRVSKNHIKKSIKIFDEISGSGDYCQYCPIAVSLRERFPSVDKIEVIGVEVKFQTEEKSFSAFLDYKSKRFLDEFDYWNSRRNGRVENFYQWVSNWVFKLYNRPRPIEFTLKIPEELLKWRNM